jgi:hypothetical protein
VPEGGSSRRLVWACRRNGSTGERPRRFAATRTAAHHLTERQREVFVALALNDVPIDVLAIQLGTNRNAIYKNCSTPGVTCAPGWLQPDILCARRTQRYDRSSSP